MTYTHRQLSQKTAEEIATWHYPGIYAFYDLTADPEDYEELLSPEARGDHYFEVHRAHELIGFFGLFPDQDYVEIGFGLRPERCGQGLGASFLTYIEQVAASLYPDKSWRLSVVNFNQRAIKCYTSCGYQIMAQEERLIAGRVYPFIIMQKNNKKKEELWH